jgi:hypothetical protein
VEAERFIAFASRGTQPSGLEVRVNFGLLAGREATPAEIDELARRLLSVVPSVSIVAERRHEVSERAEASVHQVRVEVEPDLVPGGERDTGELQGRVLTVAEQWAEACVADRHATV